MVDYQQRWLTTFRLGKTSKIFKKSKVVERTMHNSLDRLTSCCSLFHSNIIPCVLHMTRYFKTTSQNIVGGHSDVQQSVRGVETSLENKELKIKLYKPSNEAISQTSKTWVWLHDLKTRFPRVNIKILYRLDELDFVFVAKSKTKRTAVEKYGSTVVPSNDSVPTSGLLSKSKMLCPIRLVHDHSTNKFSTIRSGIRTKKWVFDDQSICLNNFQRNIRYHFFHTSVKPTSQNQPYFGYAYPEYGLLNKLFDN